MPAYHTGHTDYVAVKIYRSWLGNINPISFRIVREISIFESFSLFIRISRNP